MTERFFSALPPADGELAAAAAWAGEQFAGYFESLPVDFERAERLVAVGGTVTTLVALVHELEPYDSSFVHLRELSLEQVSAAIERMSTLDADSIAALPGVQPKRAGVILAGAVVIRELMRARRLRHAHRKREQPACRHGRHHQRGSRRRDPHHRLGPQPERSLTVFL